MDNFLPFMVFAAIFALVWTVLKVLSKKSMLPSDDDNKARQADAELALKQDMIKRGMSADEIERVLKASGDGKSA